MSAYEQTGARGRRGLGILGVLALALCLAAGLALGTSAQAKKKHKKQPRVFAAQISPNVGVPEYPGTGHATPVLSTITVGKKFKGKTVGDVNLTGLRTTGSGPGAADDVFFKLTAPNGRTVQLIGSFFAGSGIGDQNIGPLTIDDDSPVSICDSDTLSCRDPAQTLIRPFAGTANEQGLGSQGTGGLKTFRGVGMRGTWTLTAFDTDNAGGTTSVLNSWGLQISAQKPPKKKKSTKK
jgi:hypothetical protein